MDTKAQLGHNSLYGIILLYFKRGFHNDLDLGKVKSNVVSLIVRPDAWINIAKSFVLEILRVNGLCFVLKFDLRSTARNLRVFIRS